MNSVKKIIVAVVACALMLSIVGCGYDPDESGVYVSKDGKIISAEVTAFDNSDYETPRYDEVELQEYIQGEVKTYNTDKAHLAFYDQKDSDETLPVAIKKLKVEDGKAKLLLEFSDASNYLGFFGVTEAAYLKDLVVGTVSDGISSGVTFEGMLDSDGQNATAAEIKEDTDYLLVKVYGESNIEVDGKIVYYSKTMTKVDKHTVTASGIGTEYIIFK